MQLRAISFQAGAGPHTMMFSESYAEMFSIIHYPGWDLRVKMFVDLLRYLENEVDAPTQWLSISHGDLSFHSRDCAVYGDETYDATKTTFHLGLTSSDPPRYCIEAILPEASAPWDFVTGTTADIAQAGQMIQNILSTEGQVWI